MLNMTVELPRIIHDTNPYLLGLVAKDSAKVIVGEYVASLTTQQKTIVCELVAA
jgi:hypothetical protein